MKRTNRLVRFLAVMIMILSLVPSATAAAVPFDPVGEFLQQIGTQLTSAAETAAGDAAGTADTMPSDTENTVMPEEGTEDPTPGSGGFQPGIYTVTANIYIDGSDNTILTGTTAYLTNPNMPPLQPVSDNGRLEILEDGSLILTVSDLNDIVSLRNIGGSSNVEILERIMEGSGDSAHINGLRMKLLNDSGSYTFTNCVEKPVILGTEQHMPLKMTVDLNHLEKGFSGFTDSGDTSEGITADSPETESPIGTESPAPSAEQEVSDDADSPDISLFERLTSLVSGVFGVVTRNIRNVISTVTGGSSSDSQSPSSSLEEGALKEGSYRVTANVSIRAELNQVIHQNVYLTNPANPEGKGGSAGLPTEPVTDNALLTIGPSGERTLTVRLSNPVITAQQVGNGTNATILDTCRDSETYTASNGYSHEGRITQITVSLLDGSGVYTLENCREFATLIGEDWEIPLTLEVDFDSAAASDGTVPEPEDTSAGTETGNDDPAVQEPEHATEIGTTADGKLEAGTYTVSANIWFSKEDTGLPMNPHITSSAFPPNNPVSNNATLTVDSSGRGTLTVPITIQQRVMSVRSISGLPIVSSQSSGGRLTSITLDMGVMAPDRNAVTRSCTASVSLGDLAMQMSGLSRDHTWPATFQMNFTGLPNSGGGELTEDQQKALDEANAEAAAEEGGSEEEAANTISGKGTLDKPAEDSRSPAGTIGIAAGAAAALAALGALIRRKRRR